MIIGHQKQWNFLRRAAESKRFSHAYLFSGQEKLGKRTLALEWISFLFNQNLQKNNHPDLIFIEPQTKEIQISQVRDLIWRLSLKSSLAPLKAAIIDNAHLMNQEAQTSLLKTLEEPRGNTLLILISEYPQYLLPTILSRVEEVKFYPVKKEEIKNYLKNQGLAEREAEEISRISSGKSGQAINFLLNSQKLKDWERIRKELITILNSDLAVKFQYVKELSQKDNLKEILEIWLAFFRENLMLKIKAEPEKIRRGLDTQQSNPLDYSLTKIKNILSKIQTINFLIATTNVNIRLALETFMLDL